MSAAISIVVPAYNRSQYIRACMESLVNQTLEDIEIIVVNDASTDDTLAILREYESRDQRIRIIDKHINEGLHMARQSAVAHSTGQYILFVDADDDIDLNACELLWAFVQKNPADIVRFGMNVILEGQSTAEEQRMYDHFFNQSNGDLRDEDILRSSFSHDLTQWVPWNVISTMFAGDLTRQAFARMESSRLIKIEDGYEYFVICLHARILRSCMSLRAVNYHLGRGISGRSRVSIERFIHDQQCIVDVVKALRRFMKTIDNPSSIVLQSAQWFEQHARKIVGDELTLRVAEIDLIPVIEGIKKTWGDEQTCAILLPVLIKHLDKVIQGTCDLKDYPYCQKMLQKYCEIRSSVTFHDEQVIKDAQTVDLQRMHITKVNEERYEQSLHSKQSKYHWKRWLRLRSQ